MKDNHKLKKNIGNTMKYTQKCRKQLEDNKIQPKVKKSIGNTTKYNKHNILASLATGSKLLRDCVFYVFCCIYNWFLIYWLYFIAFSMHFIDQSSNILYFFVFLSFFLWCPSHSWNLQSFTAKHVFALIFVRRSVKRIPKHDFDESEVPRLGLSTLHRIQIEL